MKILLFICIIFPVIVFSQTCEERLEKDFDKFSSKKTFYTPLLEKAGITKVIEKGVAVYYFTLSTYGSTLNVSEEGVDVLFENGEKLKWEKAEIEVESTSSGWEYSCFIKISTAILDKLIKNRITDFRLYIYEGELTEKQGEDFKCYAEAIKKAR